MRAKGPNRRGVALIVVLLMISIIIAVTIQLNRDTRSEVNEAANLSDGIRLRYVAESGFYRRRGAPAGRQERRSTP